jgi:hypothetical protein
MFREPTTYALNYMTLRYGKYLFSLTYDGV